MPRSRRCEPLPAGFGVIWSTVAIDLIGFGIAIPVLALFATREFGATPTQAGLLFASFSLAQFACAPVMGRLSDRIGRKPVLLISLFGSAAGSFVTGFAGALWMLFLGRIIDGASGASVAVAQAAATDLTDDPTQRPRLLGLLGAAFGVGFSVGPAIAAVAAWLGGPRVPFVVAGVLALVNGLVALRRLPETRTSRAPATGAGPATPHRSGGSLARLAVVGFAAVGAFSGFEATFALLGEARFGLREAGTALVFLGIGVLAALVQAGGVAPTVHRLGTLTALRTGLAVNALGLLTLAVATSWAVLGLALVLLVVGQGLTTPTLISLVSDRAGDVDRGRALGRQQAVSSLARVAGPALAGVLFQHVGVPAPSVVGVALFVFALAVLTLERAPGPMAVGRIARS